MTPLDRLGRLSRLILDLRLAEVQAANRAREESLGHLRALESASASDLDPLAAARAQLGYDRWAEARRAEINLGLARQTAVWMAAQDKARHAFGQAEAVRALQTKKR
jgi:hypothetical protein